MKPGDVLLVSGHSPADWAIRFAQRRRDGTASRWTHAALIVSANNGGEIIESAGVHGVRRNLVDAYRHLSTVILPITASDARRQAAVAFAESKLGHVYGWADLLGIGLNLLCGDPVIFRCDHTYICSELVSRALQCAGYTWPRDASDISPGDLAVLLAARS